MSKDVLAVVVCLCGMVIMGQMFKALVQKPKVIHLNCSRFGSECCQQPELISLEAGEEPCQK